MSFTLVNINNRVQLVILPFHTTAHCISLPLIMPPTRNSKPKAPSQKTGEPSGLKSRNTAQPTPATGHLLLRLLRQCLVVEPPPPPLPLPSTPLPQSGLQKSCLSGTCPTLSMMSPSHSVMPSPSAAGDLPKSAIVSSTNLHSPRCKRMPLMYDRHVAGEGLWSLE